VGRLHQAPKPTIRAREVHLLSAQIRGRNGLDNGRSGGGDCVKIIILQIITLALFVGCIYEIMTMGGEDDD
jgi:hypothetical protein